MLPGEFSIAINDFCNHVNVEYSTQVKDFVYSKVRNWTVCAFKSALEILENEESLPRNLWGAIYRASRQQKEKAMDQMATPGFHKPDAEGYNLQVAYVQVCTYILKSHAGQYALRLSDFHNRFWYPLCGQEARNKNSHSVLMSSIRDWWAEQGEGSNPPYPSRVEGRFSQDNTPMFSVKDGIGLSVN